MSTRALALYFALVVFVFLALLVLALRPSLVLGVDGETLADSVSSAPGAAEPCREAGALWLCRAAITSSSGREVEVAVDAWGCWKARNPGTDDWTRTQFDGCITILDH